MNTVNKHFNLAWQSLAEMFESANLPGGESIDLQSPKQHISNRLWNRAMHDVVRIVAIGQRESLIQIHTDWQGQNAYLLVPKDKEVRPCSSR